MSIKSIFTLSSNLPVEKLNYRVSLKKIKGKKYFFPTTVFVVDIAKETTKI